MHRLRSFVGVIGKGKAGIQSIQKKGRMVTGKAVFAAGTAAALGRDDLSAEGTAGGPEEMQQLPQWCQSGHGSHRLCLQTDEGSADYTGIIAQLGNTHLGAVLREAVEAEAVHVFANRVQQVFSLLGNATAQTDDLGL